MKRKIDKVQNISRMCMMCGAENPSGLHAAFYELEGDEVLGVFQTREVHQGYTGRVHGGMATAMLDETIGRAINIADPEAWGVTIELSSVRFRRPVPIGEVRVLARITKDSGRAFEGTGEIVLDDGTVAVEAQGRYLKLPIDKIAEADFESQWFADGRPAPDHVDI